MPKHQSNTQVLIQNKLSEVVSKMRNIFEISRRKISQGSPLSDMTLTKEEYTNKFLIENVTITPGTNHLQLQMKVIELSFSLNERIFLCCSGMNCL